jgi:hypothetical protein
VTAATASITVRVPIAIRWRGGRKVIVALNSVATPDAAAVPTRGDPVLVKTLPRAHRWARLLESGRYRSLRELTATEGVDRGYAAQMLRLTLLAPDIVGAILDGRQPARIMLSALMKPFLAESPEQRAAWACSRPEGRAER